MNDSERIYALYVQANPVPHPASLPLTQAEAELLTFERSTDMDTREKNEVRPAPPIPRRRRLVFGLAAVVVVAAAAAAITLFVAGGDDDSVAAADTAPRITFDGAACRYDGPTLIEAGTVTFTVTNTGTETIRFTGFNTPGPSLDAELERTPLGTDMALSATSPTPEGTMSFIIIAAPGAEKVSSWSLGTGTHILDCVTEAMDHVWRTRTLLEVLAP